MTSFLFEFGVHSGGPTCDPIEPARSDRMCALSPFGPQKVTKRHQIWSLFGTIWHQFRTKVASESVKFRSKKFNALSYTHYTHYVTQAPRGGGRWHGTGFWRAGKTSISGKNIAKLKGKRQFRKTAQTGAVRKGGLLRGKVSQGRPHPLSMALRFEVRA